MVIDNFNIIANIDFRFGKKFILGGVLLGLLPSSNRTFIKRIKNAILSPDILAKLSPDKLAKYISNSFKEKFRNQDICYDLVIKGGVNANNIKRFKTCESTEYLEAHAFDYDRYLEEENKKISNTKWKN